MAEPVITTESDTVTRIEDGDRTIWLIGTAHVSEESVREVERIIDEVEPDTVCIELCEPRYKALTDPNRWKNLDIFQVIREGKTLFLLSNIAIGAYQRRLGAELGVKPGAELLAAANKAQAVGAKVELIDRSIHITLKRTWARLGFWKKSMLLGAIVEAMFPGKKEEAPVNIEQLKERAHLSKMMGDFAKALPEVHGPLIDERDQYLIAGTRAAPGKRIVAVVGAGHVPGMLHYYQTPIDRAPLDVIPPPSRWTKVFEYGIIALVFGLTWYNVSQGDESLEHMVRAWVVPTAFFCALFTAFGLARPLTIVVAALSAPLTTLIPLIVAGMPVGLCEAWLRRPTVEDCERINEDVQSLRGLYKNRFTRVLLVAFLSTMGAAIGAYVGIGWLVSYAR